MRWSIRGIVRRMRHTRAWIVGALSLGAVAVAVAAGCAANHSRAPRGPDATAAFAPVLADHLARIAARDLPGLLATVGDDVTLILPNGALLEGKAKFQAFHEDWFASKTWTMELRELRRLEGADQATVVFDTVYRDTDEQGAPVVALGYLALTFRHSGGRWLLVHDQNTRRPPRAP